MLLKFRRHYATLPPHWAEPGADREAGGIPFEIRHLSGEPGVQARRVKASIGLPPQERRNVELIVIRRWVRRCGPAMHVKTLRGPTPGIFRDRLRST